MRQKHYFTRVYARCFSRFCENSLEQIPLLFQMFLRISNFIHSVFVLRKLDFIKKSYKEGFRYVLSNDILVLNERIDEISMPYMFFQA